MTDGTGGHRRCRHCRRVLPGHEGAGRPREFCSGACRQRDWVFRRRAEELKLSDDELIVLRAELDALYDELYVLACAIQDAERDGAFGGGASMKQVSDALRWIVEAARPVTDPDRLSPLRP
jgi:hypothetical protein